MTVPVREKKSGRYKSHFLQLNDQTRLSTAIVQSFWNDAAFQKMSSNTNVCFVILLLQQTLLFGLTTPDIGVCQLRLFYLGCLLITYRLRRYHFRAVTDTKLIAATPTELDTPLVFDILALC